MHACFTSRTHLIIIYEWYSMWWLYNTPYMFCVAVMWEDISPSVSHQCCTIVNVNDSFWFSAPGEPTLPTEGKLHDHWWPLTRPKITHLHRPRHQLDSYINAQWKAWSQQSLSRSMWMRCVAMFRIQRWPYIRSHESVWGVSHSCKLSCLDYTFSSTSV